MSVDSTLKLCLVKGSFAYFTDQDVADQDGPLWEEPACRAGPPDNSRGQTILKIAYDVPDYVVNVTQHKSPRRVNEVSGIWIGINVFKNQVQIHSGTTLSQFIDLITEIGGELYFGDDADYEK